MKVGKYSDFTELLAVEGIQLGSGLPIMREGSQFICVTQPTEYARHLYMLELIFEPFLKNQFPGGALNIDEHIVCGEEYSEKIFDHFRGVFIESKLKMAEATLTIFDTTEYLDFYFLTLWAALARWDASVFVPGFHYLIFFSHDGFVDIGGDGSIVSTVDGRLREFGFQVRKRA